MIAKNFFLWMLSYGLHSTLLFLISRLILALPAVNFNRHRELVLRLALFGAIPTSIFQTCFGMGLNLTTFSNNVLAPDTTTAYVAAENISSSQKFITGDTVIQVLLVAWFVWLLFSFGIYILRRRQFLSRLRPLSPGDSQEIRHALDEVQRALPRPLKIFVAISPRLESPITVGGRFIYLPSPSVHSLTAFQLKCLFAHEVAHIFRKDNLWMLLYKIIDCIFFFQPLNRIIIRELNEVSEKICDSWAATVTGNRLEVARCLVTVASWYSFPNQALHFPGAVSGKSQLRERIEILISKHQDDKPLNKKPFYFIFFAVVGAMVLLMPGFAMDNKNSGLPESVSIAEAQSPQTQVLQKKPKKNSKSKQKSQHLEDRRGPAKTKMTGEHEVEVKVEQNVNVAFEQQVEVESENTVEVQKDVNVNVVQEVELDIKPVKPATSNKSTRPKNAGHTRRVKPTN